ncbi:related to kinesin light chain 1 [Fusarium torulosum]|uniref:Related to kinesin light chain 1 n=1 Tax=Fusarium torulosum TaxID=33205 RepID=A0AAE8MEV0_9HYPO|nr:related to kinesin light chain 1 [Fusarium torulosum]
MNNLALTYWNQGRWEEAEKLQVRVMEIRKVKFGEDHPHTLTSMNNLASTYWNQGRWEEAEKLQANGKKQRSYRYG